MATEIRRLSEETAAGRPHIASGTGWEPRVDMVEEDHRLLIKAEIAGMRGDDIHLLYIPERHTVLLRGSRPELDFSDGSRVGIHQLEILYGEFEREIRLPDVAIDAQGIRAQYRNGFLVVMVPKMERVVATRTIRVRKA